MTSPAPSRPRILWVDIIRTLSGFGVLFTHVAMEIVNYWGKRPIQTGDEGWWITSVFYSFTWRVCLGLFFMLSGYLLLSKQSETFTFLRKSLWKLLVPLAFWGTFYLIWRGDLPEDPLKLVKQIILTLVTGKVEYHMWFLYPFIGIYLFVPIIRIFIRTAEDRDVWYWVGLWFLLVPVSTLFFQYTGDVIALMNFGAFSGFIGFFLLGHLLGRSTLDPKWALIAGLLVLPWTVGETYWLYSQTRALKAMQDQWFDTLSITMIPHTILVFIALKGWGERLQRSLKASSRVPAIWETLSRAGFGTILLHVFILENMYSGFGGIHLAPYDFHPALSVPIVSLVGYGIGLVVVLVVQKIPYVRAILPV